MPWAASMVALQAAIERLRKKWSFWPRKSSAWAARSAGAVRTIAEARRRASSEVAAAFRLWHSSPIWSAWAIMVRRSSGPCSLSARVQGRAERRGQPAQPSQHLLVVRPEAEHLAQPLVHGGEGAGAARRVLDDHDRHARREDAGHRADRAVIVARLEADGAGLGQRLGGLGRVGPALEEDRADDGAPDRPAHPLPGDRRAGVEDGARAESGHHLRRRPHADEHRPGGRDPLDGQCVRGTDPCPNGVVRVVLQARQQQAQVAVAVGRRAPVELDHLGAVGAGRGAELGDADVDDAGLGREDRHQAGSPVVATTGRHGLTSRGGSGASPTIRAASRAAWALLGASRTPAARSVGS